MSDHELKHYTCTQLRIIRQYHNRVHPELNVNDAAMMWIKRYAKMFRTWSEKHAR